MWAAEPTATSSEAAKAINIFLMIVFVCVFNYLIIDYIFRFLRSKI